MVNTNDPTEVYWAVRVMVNGSALWLAPVGLGPKLTGRDHRGRFTRPTAYKLAAFEMGLGNDAAVVRVTVYLRDKP